MTLGPDHPAHAGANAATGTVFGNVVQANRIEGGVHHNYYGARRHVVEAFPATSRPDGAWLMAQPSRLLDARSQVVPFTGRETELRQLGEWRDSSYEGLSVLLLHAPGGQGKTRLAAEFAERSRSHGLPAEQRWTVLQAGFRGGPAGNGIPAVEHGAAGVLLIVDYADRWAYSELDRLLSEPVLRQRRARVLMIGRTVRWYAAIRGGLAERDAIGIDLALPELADDRTTTFAVACERYGRPDLYDLPDAASIEPPGSLEHGDFGLTLTLHMAALVAVDAHKRGQRPSAAPYDLSAYLLDREFLAWQRLYDAGAHGQDYQTRPVSMAKAVFTAVLTGAVGHDTGTKALRALDLPGHPQHLLDDHRFCYPPTDRELVLEPLYPDRLAEDFLALLTPGHDVSAYVPDPWAKKVPAVLLTALDELRPEIAPRAVTFLASAAGRWPHVAHDVLYPLLREDPRLAVDAGSSALTALAAIDDLPDDVLLPIDEVLPEGRHVDLDIGAAAISGVLTPRMLAAIPIPEVRAQVHANHSERMAAAGRHEEAWQHSEQSLRLWTILVEVDRGAHLPGLAAATHNHAIRMEEIGRSAEAMEVSQRAVEYATELVESDRATHLAALAVSMTNHAVRLAKAGRDAEAATLSRRVTELREEVTRTNPSAPWPAVAGSTRFHAQRFADSEALVGTDLESALAAVNHFSALAEGDRAAHLPGLAASVSNLAVALSEAGRVADALAVSERAVGLREELTSANRATHLPGLAASVHNHASRLAEAGRTAEALVVSRRAVELREELTKVNRATHLPDLAASEYNHASHLVDANEALEFHERAVEHYRESAELDRPAHLAALAASTKNYVLALSEAGRRADALIHSGHVVDYLGELAELDRPTHLPALAEVTRYLASLLAWSGRRAEALTFSRRAVEHYDELVRSDRVAYLPGLTATVREHMSVLAEEGQRQEALVFSGRAVAHYRELAEADRGTHLVDLAMSTGYHATKLAEAGRQPEAVEYSRQAIDLLDELAGNDRAAYLSPLTHLVGVHAEWLEETGHPAEALAHFERALDLLGEAAVTNPAACLPILVQLERQHAVRLARLGRAEEALEHSRRAVDLSEELATGNGFTGLHGLADSLYAFMLVRASLTADLDAAAQAGTRAVDLFRNLAATQPAAFARQLSDVTVILIDVLRTLGRVDDAERVRRDHTGARE